MVLIAWLRGECVPLERIRGRLTAQPTKRLAASQAQGNAVSPGCDACCPRARPSHSMIERPGWLSKGQGGGAATLEPGFAPACSEGRQRIGSADGRLEPTAELPDRLDPTVADDFQSLENRRKVGRDRPSTRRTKLSTGPVEQRQVLVELDRQRRYRSRKPAQAARVVRESIPCDGRNRAW